MRRCTIKTTSKWGHQLVQNRWWGSKHLHSVPFCCCSILIAKKVWKNLLVNKAMGDSIFVESFQELMNLASSIECWKSDCGLLSFWDNDWGYNGLYLWHRAWKGKDHLHCHFWNNLHTLTLIHQWLPGRNSNIVVWRCSFTFSLECRLVGGASLWQKGSDLLSQRQPISWVLNKSLLHQHYWGCKLHNFLVLFHKGLLYSTFLWRGKRRLPWRSLPLYNVVILCGHCA